MDRTMNKSLLVFGGASLGAAVMYVLDPQMGNRRRSLLRDKISRSANLTGEAMGTTWRDARNRGVGLVASLKSRFSRDPVDDRVLAERVRSKVGTVVKHPRSIDVTAENGRVTLSGPILAHEVNRLIDTVQGVRGVVDVENRLDMHREPDNVPGLQGNPPRPRRGEQFELMQTNWSPTTRLLAGGAGGALVVYGVTRQNIRAAGLGLIGLALVGRALTI